MRGSCLVLAALLAAAASAAGDSEPECSGHGHKIDDGSCACDRPWPEPGSSGWTGPECRIAVFSPPADAQPGVDVTAHCKEQGCGSLQPGAWHCFAVRAAFK